MKEKFFPIVLLSFFLTANIFSCKNEKPQPAPPGETKPSISLEKSWVMTPASGGQLPPKGRGSGLQTQMSKGMYETKNKGGYSWHFFSGGVLVELAGASYREGKWASSDGDKTLTISFLEDKKEEAVQVKYLGSDSLLVSLGKGENASDVAFRNDGATYENAGQNPYHPASNRWRIKPTASETDEQLRARIRNHLHHLVLILESGLKHNLKTVSFRASPSCFHQYNSSVALEKESEWPEDFANCFFDKNDVGRAYDIIDHEMRTNKSAETSAKQNWVYNNHLILKNLEEGFSK